MFNQVAMLIQIIHTISQSYLDILDNLSTIKSTLYYTKFHYALIRLQSIETYDITRKWAEQTVLRPLFPVRVHSIMKVASIALDVFSAMIATFLA